MAKKSTRNTKSRIVDAAWKLFYEQGYEDTTVEEIIALSGTSKGSFYHYFGSKDDLLGSLAYLFDEKYEELACGEAVEKNAIDALLYLNRELFAMIENRIDLSLLSRLLSTQLTVQGGKQLLDRNRVYFRLLRRIVAEGQARGEITEAMTASEIVRLYAMTERGLLYDWCLRGGDYSLSAYGEKTLPLFLEALKK
ncbi:MAG: TetR/AcrR family transcriptional regulator [Ruminococcaceae bacterium]|nr:TetR/AcrR family transcriptional regulator [Oscillospiraceae bacterium]